MVWKYEGPVVAVDTIIEKNGKIVLVRRAKEPFEGKYVIPGGFIEKNETAEEAAVREAFEETGLRVKLKNIMGVYSDPRRDPRIHNLTIIFVADYVDGELKGGDDAADAKWFDLNDAVDIVSGFDHKKILKDYLKWRETKDTFWSKK